MELILNGSVKYERVYREKKNTPYACFKKVRENKSNFPIRRGRLDDRGVAYGLIAVIGFLVLGGLLIVLLGPLLNGIVDGFNTMISGGWVSEQTAGAFSWNLTLFGAIPVIGVFGIAIWAIVRANRKEEV